MIFSQENPVFIFAENVRAESYVHLKVGLRNYLWLLLQRFWDDCPVEAAGFVESVASDFLATQPSWSLRSRFGYLKMSSKGLDQALIFDALTFQSKHNSKTGAKSDYLRLKI